MRKLLGCATALLLVLVASVAFAIPPAPVSECGTAISEPGKYRLVNDLVDCTENGVTITGSDIVLDLDGHSISCDTDGGLLRLGGVVVWSPDWSTISNVTVKNGHVSDCADGILLVFTKDSKVKKMSSSRNLAWQGASGSGITVWFSENTLVTKNHTYENELQGIGVWDSTGTVVRHNMATTNYVGIWTERVEDTEVSCNKAYGNDTGVLLGPWSTGGLVKGNLAKWNWFDGISAWGWAFDEMPWDEIASGNTFRHNISEENALDHVELVYNVDSGAIFPHPDGTCRNRWLENQFVTSWGPDNCIGQPVELVEDDVCAFDEDGGDDD
jgi:parallel beta-helix repeat protein